MIYVGVENSPKKREVAAREPSKTIYVAAEDLAWDCTRHVEFLNRFLSQASGGYHVWMITSQYFGWLKQTGRGNEAALARCVKFLELFQSIRELGCWGTWATVTDDGIRLDGSHRAAIAVALHIPIVSVSVSPYHKGDEAWRRMTQEYRTRRIAKEAVCQSAKAAKD